MNRRRIIPKGHKLVELRHNGERSRQESAWTYVCECGASEETSRKDETRREYNYHIDRMIERQQQLAANAENPDYVRGYEDCLKAVKRHLQSESDSLYGSVNPYAGGEMDGRYAYAAERLETIIKELSLHCKPGE